MANDDQHASGSRPEGGPDASDPAYKQLESQRRDVHGDREPEAKAGTADADRAFEESRGNNEAREKPPGRS